MLGSTRTSSWGGGAAGPSCSIPPVASFAPWPSPQRCRAQRHDRRWGPILDTHAPPSTFIHTLTAGALSASHTASMAGSAPSPCSSSARSPVKALATPTTLSSGSRAAAAAAASSAVAAWPDRMGGGSPLAAERGVVLGGRGGEKLNGIE